MSANTEALKRAKESASRSLLSPLAISEIFETFKVKEFENVDVKIKNEGTKIILPQKMTPEEGIECLQRKIKEDQTKVSVHEEIQAYPLDGAHALMAVLRNMFGWAQATPKKTFFGDKPPTMVDLEIGYEKSVQVIWGQFIVPGVEGVLETQASHRDGQSIFVIGGEVKQKYQNKIKQIADNVRDYVKKHSVYKGKAFRVTTNKEGDMDLSSPPRFLDLSRVNEEELIFPEAVAEQVKTNLFTPIEKTSHCRKYGIPLKRGVLLEGRYGTGKTLTAYVTAKKCDQNGWTFIYLDCVTGLKSAMKFAKQYAPAVIFAEDIDRVVTGDRSVDVDDILNTIDGVDSKGMELITILTTNYVEKIEKAMLRPGRLDAIISVSAPDAKAAEKLVRIYGRGLVGKDEDLTVVGQELHGQIPAVIREVVERSKLYAVGHISDGEKFSLSSSDLAAAARGMKSHLDLMKDRDNKLPTPEEAVGIAMSGIMRATLNGTVEKIYDTHGKTVEILDHLQS